MHHWVEGLAAVYLVGLVVTLIIVAYGTNMPLWLRVAVVILWPVTWLIVLISILHWGEQT